MIKSTFKSISNAEARKMLRQADKDKVNSARSILHELLFILEVKRWPSNKNDVREVLSQLSMTFNGSLFFPKEKVNAIISEAREIASNMEGTSKNDGYDIVRKVLSPVLASLPSIDKYEDALFDYSEEILCPLLISELLPFDLDLQKRLNILRILSNSEYAEMALPSLGQILRKYHPGHWDFKNAADLAESILMNNFDSWYKEIRGRSYQEDRELEKKEDERREERRREERREEERRERKREFWAEERRELEQILKNSGQCGNLGSIGDLLISLVRDNAGLLTLTVLKIWAHSQAEFEDNLRYLWILLEQIKPPAKLVFKGCGYLKIPEWFKIACKDINIVISIDDTSNATR